MRPAASNPTSLLGRAPVLPHVLWLSIGYKMCRQAHTLSRRARVLLRWLQDVQADGVIITCITCRSVAIVLCYSMAPRG
jgi:hypothetical protein